MSKITTYDDIKVLRSEILKYIRVKEETSEVSNLIDECLKELENKLVFKVISENFDIGIKEDIDLSFTKVNSNSLKEFLLKNKKVNIFVATIGIEIDRLVLKYEKISPSKAVVINGIGVAYIEALCDRYNEELTSNHKRFSPGYGDLDLSLQKDIFKVLNPEKIGVTLNESLLMSPSKSVSAIIGL